MVAVSVIKFELDPIIIEGGTYEQQMFAIKSSLKQGFTHITVHPPTNADHKPEEYDQIVTLAHHVRDQFHTHGDCLDALRNLPHDDLMPTLYQQVSASTGAGDLQDQYQSIVGIGNAFPPPAL